MYTTPDMDFSAIPGSQVQPSSLEELLMRLAQQGTPPQPEQNPLFEALANQGMTRGLGINDGSIAQIAGRPEFSGPQAGYAGPLRPSDVPLQRAVAPMPHADADKVDVMGTMGGVSLGGTGPVKNVKQLMEMLPALKDVPKDILEVLMGKLTGIDPNANRLARDKDLATFKHELDAPERAGKAADRQVTQERLKNDSENREEDRRTRRHIPMKDARQRMIDAYEAGERDPVKLAEHANGMGYKYGGGTSNTVLGIGTDQGYEPRLLLREGAQYPQQGAQAPQGATQPQALPKAPKPGTKLTDRALAKQFLDAAGGDIKRAEAAARAQGWLF